MPETAPPTQNYGEPPTMAAARARIHEIARELPSENRFGGIPHNHGDRFNDETQGRIEGVDLAAAHAAYDRQFGAPLTAPQHYQEPSGYSDGYDQAGQGQHHYHAEYQHQDPMTELRPQYDEALNRHENQYGRGSDRPMSDPPLPEDDSSGEYQRRAQHHDGHDDRNAAPYNSNSYDQAAYEANYPKPARREEPSYVDRAPPSSDRPAERSGERGSERGNSFRNDDFPRDKSSYRDEARERGSIRRDEPRREERREEPRGSYREPEQRERGNSFSRRERDENRDEERANSYQPPRGEPADHTRAEGSGAKHASDRGSSYSKNERERNESPSIPGPARVPAELRVPDNFVVGVQPIRTPSMGASAYPQPQAVITPSSYGPPATMAASPGAMGGSMPPGMPQITMPPMMAPQMGMAPMNHMGPMTGPMGGMSGINAMNQGMHVRAHTSMRPGGHVAQPTEVEEAAQGSKVGRFAWFVFGAAFGIFFAFAATGFGFGKKDEAPANNFPAPVQLPAPVQTQAQAPVPPPVAPPPVVILQPPPMQQQQLAPQVQMAPQVQQQQYAPVAQMAAPPPGVMVAPGQQMAPIVPAPQAQSQQGGPRGQQVAQNQGTVRVRPAAPAPGPRRGGGRAAPRGDDDDAPAPKPKAGKDDNAADILGAAL